MWSTYPNSPDLPNDSEDWTQITDARLRKRVQNRLSQRKHRLRCRQYSLPDDLTGHSTHNVRQPLVPEGYPTTLNLPLSPDLWTDQIQSSTSTTAPLPLANDPTSAYHLDGWVSPTFPPPIDTGTPSRFQWQLVDTAQSGPVNSLPFDMPSPLSLASSRSGSSPQRLSFQSTPMSSQASAAQHPVYQDVRNMQSRDSHVPASIPEEIPPFLSSLVEAPQLSSPHNSMAEWSPLHQSDMHQPSLSVDTTNTYSIDRPFVPGYASDLLRSSIRPIPAGEGNEHLGFHGGERSESLVDRRSSHPEGQSFQQRPRGARIEFVVTILDGGEEINGYKSRRVSY